MMHTGTYFQLSQYLCWNSFCLREDRVDTFNDQH